jgi:hypothetical protein
MTHMEPSSPAPCAFQFHALAHNLGNFLRALATPEPIKDWSLTTLKEKLIKIGAKVVSHGRYVAFQLAEVTIPRDGVHLSCVQTRSTGEVRLDDGKSAIPGWSAAGSGNQRAYPLWSRSQPRFGLVEKAKWVHSYARTRGHLANSGLNHARHALARSKIDRGLWNRS